MSLKLLSIQPHFDDHELTAAGTFELWKRKLGVELEARLLVCTDGQAGHHERSRAETGKVRLEEQAASARVGGYEFECLQLPGGEMPREGGLQSSLEVLAALWRAIRQFQPDYVFCPPVPRDPLVGVHPDHVGVAEAVRRVAYMVNVPHAFTPEFPGTETEAEPVPVPVILNVHDSYMTGGNQFDLVVDVEDAFDVICRTSYCHQSQIAEWLPWVGRHDLVAPGSLEDWSVTLRRRFAGKNRELGLRTDRAVEVFTVTAWGTVPVYEQLLADFPGLMVAESRLDQLKERLAQWGGLA